MKRWLMILGLLLGLTLVSGCTTSPELNVAGYLLSKQLGIVPLPADETEWGTLTGMVVDASGQPVAGATVIVAEQTGKPYSGQTDNQGQYTIELIPPGLYTPAAAAPGFAEVALETAKGAPGLVKITSAQRTAAPILRLHPTVVTRLPERLADEVALTMTSTHTATAPYPANSVARVYAYEFNYHQARIDTLRLYLPLEAEMPDVGQHLPVLFMVYPTQVDLWETVSIAFAAQGFALVAISPVADRGLDIDAHAQDAYVALELASTGALHPQVIDDHVVALGGSFSSAILNRLLRDAGPRINAWVTVGGIGNAFTGAADFYAGRVTVPAQYEYLIPALGSPRLYPLPFLRYSPIYSAAQLPPTLIIHTAADTVIPLEQAQELEQALRSAGIPVEVFYYEDVSHYLQIDENLTDAGKAMFTQILTFIEKYRAVSQDE